jgi:hypothetical protein
MRYGDEKEEREESGEEEGSGEAEEDGSEEADPPARSGGSGSRPELGWRSGI